MGWALSHPWLLYKSAQDAEEKVRGRGESGGEGPRTEEGGRGLSSPQAHLDQLSVHAGHAPVQSKSPLPVPGSSTAGTEDHFGLGGSLSPAAAPDCSAFPAGQAALESLNSPALW